MKIGVCLIGVSYSEGEKGRDWTTCAMNIKKTFGDVDYFISTYEYYPELKNFFNPRGYQVIKYKGSTQRSTYVKALEFVSNVDFIITTRFDAYFHKTLPEMNIDYKKFNFAFKELGTWDNHRFVADGFFALPFKMRKDFIRAIKALDHHPLKKNFMHHIYPYINSFIEHNFILDKEQSSKENELFNLIRICTSPLE